MDQTNIGPSGDEVVYTASALPKGLTLDSGTGCCFGTLLAGPAGRALDAGTAGQEPPDDDLRPDLFIDAPPPPDSGSQ